MLASITLLKSSHLPPVTIKSHELNNDLIQIVVKGAVHKTGNYEVKRGATIQDVLNLAQPLEQADLNKLKLAAKLRNHQTITVQERRKITVHITGAVTEPTSLTVEQGMMVKELAPLLSFLPEADSEKLNRKRKLKDGETISVPAKKTNRKKIASKSPNKIEEIK